MTRDNLDKLVALTKAKNIEVTEAAQAVREANQKAYLATLGDKAQPYIEGLLSDIERDGPTLGKIEYDVTGLPQGDFSVNTSESWVNPRINILKNTLSEKIGEIIRNYNLWYTVENRRTENNDDFGCKYSYECYFKVKL